MAGSSTAISLTFLAYLAVVIVIGFVAWRRTSDLKDYILGGRRLGRWVTALSAQASDMSGWLLLGLPGYAYLAGVESLWLLVGLLTGTYLNWKLTAARLRRATEYYGDSLTLPDYLERRFDDRTGSLRLISALFILVFFTFYTSSGLVAGGRLFEQVFGLSYLWAVAAGGATVVAYTFVGGFLAVSWTDLLQGILMLLALVAVAVMGIVAVGGLDAMLVETRDINPELLNAFTDADGQPLTLIAIVSLLGWGLGYFGQPHVLARFMAADSEKNIPASRRIAMTWVTVALFAGMLVGMTGAPLLEAPLVGAESEKVFMVMATTLFHPVIAGICLSGILAAVMSTADSQLLVASSAVAEDLFRGIFRKQASDRELLWIGRMAVIVIALIAFALAADPDSKVLDLVAYAWAGFGAAFGPAILLSLYWPGMSRRGAIAGILMGGLTVIVWKQLSGGIFDLYEIVPGVVFSFVAIFLFSRFPRSPNAGQGSAQLF
jgi:sodium/proline symporter